MPTELADGLALTRWACICGPFAPGSWFPRFARPEPANSAIYASRVAATLTTLDAPEPALQGTCNRFCSAPPGSYCAEATEPPTAGSIASAAIAAASIRRSRYSATCIREITNRWISAVPSKSS